MLKQLLIGAAFAAVAFAATIAFQVLLARAEYNQRVENVEELKERRERYREQQTREDLDFIIRALESDKSHRRVQAATSLRQLGPLAAPAIDALITAAEGEDLYVQREAMRALGSIGPAAKPAVPLFINAIKSYPDRDGAWFAAEALGEVADPDDEFVTAALKEASQYERYQLPEFARRALLRLEERRLSATTKPNAADSTDVGATGRAQPNQCFTTKVI